MSELTIGDKKKKIYKVKINLTIILSLFKPFKKKNKIQ